MKTEKETFLFLVFFPEGIFLIFEYVLISGRKGAADDRNCR